MVAGDDISLNYNALIEADITYMEVEREDNFLLTTTLDPMFELVFVSKGSQYVFSDFSMEDQQTVRSNIETYSNNGGVFVVSGYDAIYNDVFWSTLLGSNGGADDCLSVDEYETSNFSNNPACDPLFNQVFDIRGLVPEEVSLHAMLNFDDQDCLLIDGGDAISCWEYEEGDGGALFSIRPMENDGAIVWFTSDEDDYDKLTLGFHQMVLTNLLTYASGDTPSLESDQNILFVSTLGRLSSIKNGISREDVGVHYELTNPDDSFAFLTPLNDEFPITFFNKSDDLDDDFDDTQKETIVSNIESYANNGGLFVVTGFDVIASSTDDLLIGILGGETSDDCTATSSEDIQSFSSNPACDPLLNVSVDIRGLDASEELGDSMDDEDCLVIGEGPAVSCLEGEDGALFSIRPMSNGGAIVWMSADGIGPDAGTVGNFAVDYYYRAILNNLIDHYVPPLALCERGQVDNEPPEYQCTTSFTIYTDHLCNGQQCTAVPELDLGFCYDPEGCHCTMSKTSGVNSGEELTAGAYEVYSEAEDENGNKSDLCSFRVNIKNSCDEEGPTMICPEEDIQLSVRSSCSLAGSDCAFMPPVFIGACRTSELCTCSVQQESGPVEGERLVPGEYLVVSTAVDKFGVSSEKCTRKVVVS
uniref:HYR domain-containing protein n=1 Tax=Vannella robusta TaxID=1487602 RepID=A0A7S4I3L1_9EUKA